MNSDKSPCRSDVDRCAVPHKGEYKNLQLLFSPLVYPYQDISHTRVQKLKKTFVVLRGKFFLHEVFYDQIFGDKKV